MPILLSVNYVTYSIYCSTKSNKLCKQISVLNTLIINVRVNFLVP
uniref:Uncharacterized protein n=1 Tax=Anguilla anguilla TaxID=7936 RepID=A0A0E9WA65_ANGAN